MSKEEIINRLEKMGIKVSEKIAKEIPETSLDNKHVLWGRKYGGGDSVR